MRRLRGQTLIIKAVLAGTVAAFALVPQAAAQLAPHRAFYELSLADMRGALSDARGAFAIEWRHACEGYTSSQRLWFVGRTDDGRTFDYDVRFSTWESADSTEMSFSMRTFAAGRLVEEVRGDAAVPADGSPGVAVYKEPRDLEVALPPGTLFPSRHLERLIEGADQGKRMVSVDLFDGAGTGEEALAKVTAVIGEPRDAGGERSWPMALAYHDVAEDAIGTPQFELSFDLTARGVMRRAVLDYGDFALEAELDRIEMLMPAVCGD